MALASALAMHHWRRLSWPSTSAGAVLAISLVFKHGALAPATIPFDCFWPNQCAGCHGHMARGPVKQAGAKACEALRSCRVKREMPSNGRLNMSP